MNQRESRSKIDLTGQDLINWLGDPLNSSQPDMYVGRLPSGISFVSLARGVNCVDYALQSKGKITRLLASQLREVDANKGVLIAYFVPSDHEIVSHVGLVIEADLIESQWGRGAVFRHGVNQIPSWYGDATKYYEIPKIGRSGKIIY